MYESANILIPTGSTLLNTHCIYIHSFIHSSSSRLISRSFIFILLRPFTFQISTEDIGVDTMNTLIDSMPRRVQALIDAKGWYTKY